LPASCARPPCNCRHASGRREPAGGSGGDRTRKSPDSDSADLPFARSTLAGTRQFGLVRGSLSALCRRGPGRPRRRCHLVVRGAGTAAMCGRVGGGLSGGLGWCRAAASSCLRRQATPWIFARSSRRTTGKKVTRVRAGGAFGPEVLSGSIPACVNLGALVDDVSTSG
jgi:hypothetical protein